MLAPLTTLTLVVRKHLTILCGLTAYHTMHATYLASPQVYFVALQNVLKEDNEIFLVPNAVDVLDLSRVCGHRPDGGQDLAHLQSCGEGLAV